MSLLHERPTNLEQAALHLGCAGRALWRVPLLKVSLALVALLWLLALTGCATPGTGSHWWAPSTWSVFSGESTVRKAGHAAKDREQAAAAVTAQEQHATHAAHVEFLKADLSLLAISAQSPEVQAALRFLRNGLSLLNQSDQLSVAEEQQAATLVPDLLSSDPKRVAAAEASQRAVETSNAQLSRDLAAANARVAKAEQRERQANHAARDAALDNIAIANQLRAYRAAACWLLLLVVVLFLGGAYLRAQLGGIGAAIHAAGAPAAVVSAIDSSTSAIGQWMLRAGRLGAAKTEAALAARLSSLKPTP